MENGFQNKIECHICGGESRYSFAKNRHNLYLCSDCDLLFVHPLPKDTSHIYSADYFAGSKNGFGYVDYDADKRAMKDQLISYLKDINNNLREESERHLLDVGAATGFFLKLALDNGFKVSGVEISDAAASLGRASGVLIKTGTLESASFASNNFDAVTMLDVIEHVPNPKWELNEVRRILKDNGLVLINTPDISSLYARKLKDKWHAIVPPEHLYYFNKENMSKLLQDLGFEIIYVRSVGKKFTVQYIIKTIASWLNISIFKKIANYIQGSFLGEIAIPINLRDNMLILARKK